MFPARPPPAPMASSLASVSLILWGVNVTALTGVNATQFGELQAHALAYSRANPVNSAAAAVVIVWCLVSATRACRRRTARPSATRGELLRDSEELRAATDDDLVRNEWRQRRSRRPQRSGERRYVSRVDDAVVDAEDYEYDVR